MKGKHCFNRRYCKSKYPHSDESAFYLTLFTNINPMDLNTKAKALRKKSMKIFIVLDLAKISSTWH